MHSEAAFQRILRKTGDIAGIGASLQTVNKHDLAPRALVRLMLEGNDRRPIIDPILLTPGWESLRVDSSRPEIACEGKQVRIPENGLEIRGQIRLYRPSTVGLLRRFTLSAKILGEDDSLRQFAHGTTQASTLVSQAKIGLFFR